MKAMWVVVWYDQSHYSIAGDHEWHVEPWDTEAAAKAVAEVYHGRGHRAWAIRLDGEGHG